MGILCIKNSISLLFKMFKRDYNEKRTKSQRKERKGVMGLEQLLEGFREQAVVDRTVMCGKCNMEYKYLGLGHYKCENCGDTVTDDYGKVRDYVEQSTEDVGVEKASADTGVAVERIRELIEMGKISLTAGKRR